MRRAISAAILALFLLALPPAASAAEMEREPSGSAMVFDILITRPLGLVATGVGAAVFVVGLPFTIPARSVKASARKLVLDPLKFTFVRPVGDVRDFDYVD